MHTYSILLLRVHMRVFTLICATQSNMGCQFVTVSVGRNLGSIRLIDFSPKWENASKSRKHNKLKSELSQVHCNEMSRLKVGEHLPKAPHIHCLFSTGSSMAVLCCPGRLCSDGLDFFSLPFTMQFFQIP